MLANIAVLRTVKANVNEAIMVALPSILFREFARQKEYTEITICRVRRGVNNIPSL